ncbi:MAG TPA: hypothetical protein VEN78_41940, partial [Bradyrhizobium sp.]|nr:hypothetical protein [Bradyrhizobium sp.]
MPLASSPPPIRDRKTESANSCYGERFFSKLLDPKAVSKARLIFFQIKHSGGIKPTEIEKWLPLTEDFFDLSKAPESFGSRYNDKVKMMMRIWREQFLRIVSQFPEVNIDYYYITGDDAAPDDYARDAC